MVPTCIKIYRQRLDNDKYFLHPVGVCDTSSGSGTNCSNILYFTPLFSPGTQVGLIRDLHLLTGSVSDIPNLGKFQDRWERIGFFIRLFFLADAALAQGVGSNLDWRTA